VATYQGFVDGTFNLGTDTSITIIDDDTGAPISLAGRLTTYKPDPKVTVVVSDPIDNGGLSQHRTAYHGWTIALSIDRATGDIDSLQAETEVNYYKQGLQKYFTIVEVTRDVNNGTIDTYTYLYCVLNLQTSGERKKDSNIVINMQFDSQQRVQQS